VLREKFQVTSREMSLALIERDEEIKLVLTALVAGENVLLVGPPGCAKSMLLDCLMKWMNGKKFSVLLTKFSTPEDVFGLISVMGMKKDEYRRVITGKMPEAHLCFIDEIFKASSAILNTMLKILNERLYEVGDGTTIKVPMRLCVAASNEWPNPETGKELGALFDRFVIRKTVHPVRARSGRQKLWWSDSLAPVLSTSITPEEVDEAARQASLMKWSKEATQAFEAIMDEINREGIFPGDRRQVKAIRVARASAWLSGNDVVQPESLEVLQHVLWDDPAEQPEKVSQIVMKIANPAGMLINQKLLEVEEALASINYGDLTSMARVSSVLGSIYKELASLKPSERLTQVLGYIKEQNRQLKVKAAETM
jgi:MoxR-like ATPase